MAKCVEANPEKSLDQISAVSPTGHNTIALVNSISDVAIREQCGRGALSGEGDEGH